MKDILIALLVLIIFDLLVAAACNQVHAPTSLDGALRIRGLAADSRSVPSSSQLYFRDFRCFRDFRGSSYSRLTEGDFLVDYCP